ncbi:uncharacterized protein L201_006076 [Kwoniella dendrophila CBS 6074]|uniref:Uncharacterized protein n=1 Tax=Kwoniella dendrophila CBS 6074 TaxID=1295534 RepID=A0AAX4K0G5_9TREE
MSPITTTIPSAVETSIDATKKAPPPEVRTQQEGEFAQPGFNPDFAGKDAFHLFMSPELESKRIGYSSKDFSGKVFTRIVPPYTPYERPTAEEGLLTEADSRRTYSPAEADDPCLIDNSSNSTDSHLYLRPNIEPQWEQDYPLSEWIIPTKRDSNWISSNEDDSKVLFLRIDRKVHAGAIWDVFRGDMTTRDFKPSVQPIILKLTKFNSFKVNPTENISAAEWDAELDPFRSTVIDEVNKEDWILRQHLGSIQGNLVPFYYGLFVWHEEDDEDEDNWIIASIMEDVGNPLHEGVSRASLEVK